MKVFRRATRIARKVLKITLWLMFVSFAIKGAMHAFAETAPEHMQSYTQPLPDGGKLLYDGMTELTYYLAADTRCGATLEPVTASTTAPPQNKVEKGQKHQVFDLPGQTKEVTFDLPK